MTEIEEIVDSLITKTKETPELSSVRFIKAYRESEAETPVSGYLAVVSVESVSKSKGFLGDDVASGLKGERFSALVRVKIYAPHYEKGQDLTGISGIFCSSVKKADTDDVIEGISFSPAGFDQQLNAMYRCCNLSIGFYLCQEAAL